MEKINFKYYSCFCDSVGDVPKRVANYTREICDGNIAIDVIYFEYIYLLDTDHKITSKYYKYELMNGIIVTDKFLAHF